ncbi:MAG TPA: hypothetical protein VMU94_00540 [Streptosporangiaceae bacterium]|nr:hypothetical protein [Streptosporangiaceae bacterium]
MSLALPATSTTCCRTARPALEAAAWLLGLLAVTIPAAITSYRRGASA